MVVTDLDTNSTHRTAMEHQNIEWLYYPPNAGRCHGRYLPAVVVFASEARPKDPQARKDLDLPKGRDRAPIDHCIISQSRVVGSAREPDNPLGP
jgi:hypothetical protein